MYPSFYGYFSFAHEDSRICEAVTWRTRAQGADNRFIEVFPVNMCDLQVCSSQWNADPCMVVETGYTGSVLLFTLSGKKMWNSNPELGSWKRLRKGLNRYGKDELTGYSE